MSDFVCTLYQNAVPYDKNCKQEESEIPASVCRYYLLSTILYLLAVCLYYICRIIIRILRVIEKLKI